MGQIKKVNKNKQMYNHCLFLFLKRNKKLNEFLLVFGHFGGLTFVDVFFFFLNYSFVLPVLHVSQPSRDTTATSFTPTLGGALLLCICPPSSSSHLPRYLAFSSRRSLASFCLSSDFMMSWRRRRKTQRRC